MLFAACSAPSAPPPVTVTVQVPADSPTTAEPVTEATTETPTTQASTETSDMEAAPQPASGSLGVVDVNKTFTDTDEGVTITIQKANTVWILPTPQADDELPGAKYADTYKHMIGLRIAVDMSKSPYRNVVVSDAYFKLAFPDGNVLCTMPMTSEKYQTYNQGTLAAIGGDKIYKYDLTTRTGDGWFICRTNWQTDPYINNNGYTIKYTRTKDVTSDGKVLPAFTTEVPVVP